MSDRELLERAARAAGYSVWGDRHPRDGLNVSTACRVHTWCPLVDDGDAFRLMAALNLNLGFDGTDQGVEVTVMAIWDGGPDAVSEVFEGNDAAPAMRRAIVRAAAAMTTC